MNFTQFIIINEFSCSIITYLHGTVVDSISTPDIRQGVCHITNEVSLENTSTSASAYLYTYKKLYKKMNMKIIE